MEFKNLSLDQKSLIIKEYKSDKSKFEIQEDLSIIFNVSKRSIRNWARKLNVGLNKQNTVLANSSKILIYDIETSGVMARVWWTGKQYIGHNQLKSEPKIISIAYKWLGEDKVYTLGWDINKNCDKELVKDFLREYNKADMVVGQNNNRFDNRWLNARAFKYGYEFNTFVKSFDIMKEAKRLFRLPSYSMAYMSKFLGVEEKQSHDGIIMWEKIESGTLKEKKKYLKKMLKYNIGDIITTEEMFLKIRKYSGHVMHFGVLQGDKKYTCPNCGGDNIVLERTTTTQAGTIQRIFKCKNDKVKYKVSNRVYMNYLKDLMSSKNDI